MKDIIEKGKEIASQINPKKEILINILSKVNFEKEPQAMGDGRAYKNNGFAVLVNNMNKYTKILFGMGVALALVLVVAFVSLNINTAPQGVQVRVAGETINVDSLVAELDQVDLSIDDPSIDDSDLINNIINADDYQI